MILVIFIIVILNKFMVLLLLLLVLTLTLVPLILKLQRGFVDLRVQKFCHIPFLLFSCFPLIMKLLVFILVVGRHLLKFLFMRFRPKVMFIIPVGRRFNRWWVSRKMRVIRGYWRGLTVTAAFIILIVQNLAPVTLPVILLVPQWQLSHQKYVQPSRLKTLIQTFLLKVILLLIVVIMTLLHLVTLMKSLLSNIVQGLNLNTGRTDVFHLLKIGLKNLTMRLGLLLRLMVPVAPLVCRRKPRVKVMKSSVGRGSTGLDNSLCKLRWK